MKSFEHSFFKFCFSKGIARGLEDNFGILGFIKKACTTGAISSCGCCKMSKFSRHVLHVRVIVFEQHVHLSCGLSWVNFTCIILDQYTLFPSSFSLESFGVITEHIAIREKAGRIFKI